jgi:hypothetical protein
LREYFDFKKFKRAGKNWRGLSGGKFLPASREQNREVILYEPASAFYSKSFLKSSSKQLPKTIYRQSEARSAERDK